MFQKNIRRPDRKWAIHENRDFRNGARLHQRHQIPTNFLRAFHGKGWNQQHAIRLRRFLHNSCKLCSPRHIVHTRLILIAIGAFHEHMIQRCRRFGFMMKHRTIRPQIARYQQPHRRFLAIGAFDFNRSGTQHMPSIPPTRPHPRHRFHPAPEGDCVKSRKHCCRILRRIDGLHRRASPAAIAAIELRDFHFLHMA